MSGIAGCILTCGASTPMLLQSGVYAASSVLSAASVVLEGMTIKEANDIINELNILLEECNTLKEIMNKEINKLLQSQQMKLVTPKYD